MTITATIPTAIGLFQAQADDKGLCKLVFPHSPKQDSHFQATENLYTEHPILEQTYCQLTEYLQGKRQHFDLSLSFQGTLFQQKVWELLREIPYGSTSSYGQLAQQLGSKHKARAVGGAAHANPLSIIVPCHRLIGSNGSLTGFAGGLSMKKYLLQLEGVPVPNGEN